MHKELLNRETLRAEDGLKYFKDTLRPHFINGAQSVFLCRFYAFVRATKRRHVEMVKWIGKFSLLLKRRRDAWMDVLPVSAMSQERRETQYFANMTQLNEERQRRNVYCFGSDFAIDQRPVARHTGEQSRKAFLNSVIT